MPNSNDVTVAGVPVHVQGNGPETLVFIHGWPDTHRLWSEQVTHFAKRYRCVHFDLPGYDGAQRVRFSIDEIAGFLKQVVEQAAGGRKVTLVLHDWGCVFGYQFYLRYPQYVERIVGVDIGDPRSLETALTLREKLMVLTYQLWLAVAWIIGGRIGDAMTRSMAARMRCPADPARIHSRMNYPYFMTWFGGRQSYRRQGRPFMPDCPMLFVYGRRKPFMLHARTWLEDLQSRPGCRVEAFDTGHWVMAEQPERFNETVGAWLADTPG